jgi:voltage-gated potassium channel
MDERSVRVAERFERPLLVAAVLTIPVTIVQLLPPADPWRMIADVLNWGIWLAFLAEVVCMLTLVPSRWQWIREHPLEIAIVVLTPPFLTSVVQSVRVLRLLRLARLLRLGPLVRTLFSSDGLKFGALLAILTLLGGGAAFASAENVPLGDGLYWAIATMTTSGSGNIAPHTTEGKVLAVILVLVGVAFAPLLIGAAAQQFVARQRPRELAQLELGEVNLLAEVREIAARLEKIQTHLERHEDNQRA